MICYAMICYHHRSIADVIAQFAARGRLIDLSQNLIAIASGIISIIFLSAINAISFVLCWSEACWMQRATIEWSILFISLLICSVIIMNYTSNFYDRCLYRDEWRTIVKSIVLLSTIYYPISNLLLPLEDRWIAFQFLLLPLFCIHRYRALSRLQIIKSSPNNKASKTMKNIPLSIPPSSFLHSFYLLLIRHPFCVRIYLFISIKCARYRIGV